MTPYTFITLNDPQDPIETMARGINNNGQIVGYYGDGASTHGFLYTGGSYTILTHPVISDHTNPQSINDVGQIVGILLERPSVRFWRFFV
jgi:probable HAF family extracellular repeat protein